jgi:hypothetical protein
MQRDEEGLTEAHQGEGVLAALILNAAYGLLHY